MQQEVKKKVGYGNYDPQSKQWLHGASLTLARDVFYCLSGSQSQNAEEQNVSPHEQCHRGSSPQVVDLLGVSHSGRGCLFAEMDRRVFLIMDLQVSGSVICWSLPEPGSFLSKQNDCALYPLQPLRACVYLLCRREHKSHPDNS